MNTKLHEPVTAEYLSTLPDDDIERDIIRGVLRETPHTWKDPDHSETCSNVIHVLGRWLDLKPKPRGKILAGNAGFRIAKSRETYIGIDVAHISSEMAESRDRELMFIDGPPALAVEILAPADTFGEISEKIDLYLEAGAVVWIVSPVQRTVAVHKPGKLVETFNESHTLDGAPSCRASPRASRISSTTEPLSSQSSLRRAPTSQSRTSAGPNPCSRSRAGRWAW